MDLRELYQDVIVDHKRSPRNFREIESADRTAEGINPLCGDKLKVFLRMDGDRIEDISFKGSGCAISVASASLMTESLKGKTEEEARKFSSRIHHMLTDQSESPDVESLGKLAALTGVKEYPSRVKCATLCWHAVAAALDQADEQVSTE